MILPRIGPISTRLLGQKQHPAATLRALYHSTSGLKIGSSSRARVNAAAPKRQHPPYHCSLNYGQNRLLSSMGPALDVLKAPPAPPATPARTLPPSRYSFHISASYSAKNTEYLPERDVWNFDPEKQDCFPPEKSLRSDAGEDAFFVSSIVKSPGEVAVGVADGIGGYAEVSVDSALFSQGLCSGLASAAHSAPADIDPEVLLDIGYRKLITNQITGGCTACVGVFAQTGYLIVANLGDSGFVVLRDGKLLYASAPQTRYFNCPLQLGRYARMEQDRPSDAHKSRHWLRNGDVVLFATDGVWDNVNIQDILGLVSGEMIKAGAWTNGGEGIMPSPAGLMASTTTITAGDGGCGGIQTVIARAVVAKAKSASLNTKVDTPFAKQAQIYLDSRYRGGKVDDITVIATVVMEEPGNGSGSAGEEGKEEKEEIVKAKL